jgi:hypothetical protein
MTSADRCFLDGSELVTIEKYLPAVRLLFSDSSVRLELNEAS